MNNRKVNLGIVISIFGGVLILLTAYLLIDLHIIDFGKEDKPEDNSVIIDDNPPIGPSITNETVSPVISEENETSQIVEPTPQPEPEPTPTPQPETQQQTTPTQNEDNSDKGTVSFDQSKYECFVGDEIDTVISASYVQSLNTQSHVKTYTSSNTKIATISKHPTISVRCIGCVAVSIKCVAEGKTTLKATSDTGATASANITVKKIPAGSINFSKSSYECNLGEKFTTDITVYSNSSYNKPDGLKSYKSNDTSIVALEASNTQPRCIGCMSVDVKCLKIGTTTITATTNFGGSVTANVKVKQDLGKINFEKSSYTCTEGDTIETSVSATTSNNNEAGSPNYIQSLPFPSSFSSGDNSVATLTEDLANGKGGGTSKALAIKCLKAGKTTLSAVSSTGATVSVPITVKEKPSTITFNPSSISCTAGKTTSVQISYSPDISYEATTENTQISTITKSPIQLNTSNTISFDVKCIKAGSTKLKFKLSNGFEKSLNITVK